MRIMERKIYSMISQITDENIIYGVKIDKNNSDPALSVSYTDNAKGFLPSCGNNGNFIDNGWESRFPFNKIKPCILKNGNVQYYLNPNDFSKRHNGTVSNITSLTDGNVMIEFPKIWYSITQDDNYIYIKYSDIQQENFSNWGISYKRTISDKFYIGAYLGTIIDDKLCSISKQLPTSQKTIGEYRTAAQANGTGYEILSWNKLLLLQILYLIRFKSLNGQTALGIGNTSSGSIALTGSTDSCKMNFGSTSSISMKFCGIEDFWGNLSQYIDGIALNADGIGGVNRGCFAFSDGNFNDIANGYSLSNVTASTYYGYVSLVQADNQLGFIPLNYDGNENTYFCDYSKIINTSSIRVPIFGGNYETAAYAGPFSLNFTIKTSNILDYSGARLMYCK